MAEELLSLKWNNHQAHFVDILTFLREQEIFIDATLACGGKLYPAHKFVLSTCSDYFKQMFTKNPNKHPIVFMKDVTCRDLEALLDFMYNGEVNVPQSSLGSLIKTAEGLQIKGLAVPDDPPVSKRDQGILRDRRERDNKLHRDNSYSPPPKRLRARERSPHISSSAPLYPSTTLSSQIRSRSPLTSLISGTTGVVLPPVEPSVDEDSRTSVHSSVSEHSPSINTKPNVNSQSKQNNEDSTSLLENLNQPHGDEPSPGPSGLHKPTQSKEEELEIKQEEDVVDLGQDDDGDWGGDDGGSIDDGGGDCSLTSENAQNFSDVMMPPTDGSLPSGDPAMVDDVCVASQFPLEAASSSHAWHPHPQESSSDSSRYIEGVSHNSNYWEQNSSISIRGAGPRHHVCDQCGKAFKLRHHLIEHVVVHSEAKPFRCQLCGASFKRAKQVKYHTRSHHPESIIFS